MGVKKNAYRISMVETWEGDCMENLGVDGTIILKWGLKKWDGRMLTTFVWLGVGTSGGLL